MIGVWGFLCLNLISPFPKPLKYFMDIALIFMVIMHGLQIAMYKAGQPEDKNLLAYSNLRSSFWYF